MSVLWQPTPERVERSTLTAFRRWLDDERGLAFDDYVSLWRWSVDELEQFWACVWDYFALGQRGETVLERRVMPGAMMASPAATTRTAVRMSSSAMSLTRNPLAPARSAP